MQEFEASDIIEVNAVKVLIYGLPGMRKTTWAMTANRPFLYDWDRGIIRVSAKYRCKYGKPETWLDTVQHLTSRDWADTNTIITDTVGASLDVCAEYIKKAYPKLRQGDGTLTNKAYGTLKQTWQQGYYTFLKGLGVDMVFVAHHREEKTTKGKDEEVFIRPDIQGGTLNTLLREMDLVGFIFMQNSRPCISFTPTENFFAKNSAGLPEIIFLDEMSLADVIQAYKDGVNADSEEYRRYLEQVAEVNDKLDLAQDEKGLNLAIETCKKITEAKAWVYSALTECKHAIKSKALELGYEKRDPETGLYLPIEPEPAPEPETIGQEPADEPEPAPEPETIEPEPTQQPEPAAPEPKEPEPTQQPEPLRSKPRTAKTPKLNQ